MALRIRVDADNCIGSGACVALAPQVFDLDDAGQVAVLADEVGDELVESTRAAAAACPAWVIELDPAS